MFILKIMSQKVDQSVDNDYQHKNIRKLEWWFVKRKVQKLALRTSYISILFDQMPYFVINNLNTTCKIAMRPNHFR